MNLSAAAALVNSDLTIVGIKGEADPAGHCSKPRSRLRVSAGGRQVKTPVRQYRHRHVQVREHRSAPWSPLSAGPPNLGYVVPESGIRSRAGDASSPFSRS